MATYLIPRHGTYGDAKDLVLKDGEVFYEWIREPTNERTDPSIGAIKMGDGSKNPYSNTCYFLNPSVDPVYWAEDTKLGLPKDWNNYGGSYATEANQGNSWEDLNELSSGNQNMKSFPVIKNILFKLATAIVQAGSSLEQAKQDIAATQQNYVTSSALDGKLASYATKSDVAASYYNKTEINNSLNNYARKADAMTSWTIHLSYYHKDLSAVAAGSSKTSGSTNWVLDAGDGLVNGYGVIGMTGVGIQNEKSTSAIGYAFPICGFGLNGSNWRRSIHHVDMYNRSSNSHTPRVHCQTSYYSYNKG